MDSRVAARVKKWLVNVLYRQPHECGAIFYNIRKLARKGGFDVDDRFARAGLSAGPEARIAASIVEQALVGGGVNGTARWAMETQVQRWLEKTPPMGL